MTRRLGAGMWGLASWLIVAAAWLESAGTLLAAEPTPTPIGGDPRSPGEGPGFVGEPLLALGGVVAIALLAIVVTTVWLRLTARPGPSDGAGPGR